MHWSEDTDKVRLKRAVRVLKKRVELAYFISDEDEAAEAHDDLVRAEWRLRMAERMRR